MQNSACLTTFLSMMLNGLNVISSSCIPKRTGWEFTSFLSCHFLSTPLFSLRLKICPLLPGLHMQRSAQQQCLMKILSMREREVLKQLKKDPSATIVASIHLSGAIAVGSVMRLNFGRGEHGLPHFYYCSVAKWILQFHSDPLFSLVQW